MSVGLLALERSLAELGVHEIPGPRSEPRISEYLAGCVRAGGLLGLVSDETPWCAAFATWAEQGLAGALPWRAAVAEVWHDAALLGLTRERLWTPRPGDLAVYRRGLGDPRMGGIGHVERVESVTDEGYWSVGGNVDDGVRRSWHRFVDPALVGWICRS